LSFRKPDGAHGRQCTLCEADTGGARRGKGCLCTGEHAGISVNIKNLNSVRVLVRAIELPAIGGQGCETGRFAPARNPSCRTQRTIAGVNTEYRNRIMPTVSGVKES